MIYKSFVKPLLFQLEAEKAHSLTLQLAKMASHSTFFQTIARAIYNYQSTRLNQQLWGLTFKNPVGLAAGFDKNGEIPGIMEAAGFGFVEVGSITANASTGNPQPRAFRLPEDHALINRMGLNNDGAKTITKRLKNKTFSIPLGINIAKTHNERILGDQAIRDYVQSFVEAKKIADYITVNISCPNTSKGKTFEDPQALHELLDALDIGKDARIVPTLVKFSPDLTKDELLKLIDICEYHHIHGYVACNTSSQRAGLKTDSKTLNDYGKGGLSGPPIAQKSIERIRWISEATNRQKPIIGVGGVDSFEVALKMFLAGADLLQIYSGLVYEGPSLVKKINRQIVQQLKELNIDTIHQLVAATS